MMHQGRKNLIIAQALHEFIKNENEKPSKEQRTSDIYDAKLILKKYYSGFLESLEPKSEEDFIKDLKNLGVDDETINKITS